MSEKFPESRERGGDRELRMQKDIAVFIVEHHVTSRELSLAYQKALGFTDVELELDSPLREEVYKLAEKLDRCMRDGMPVNKVVELIGLRGEYEQSPETYLGMVEGMYISEDEKAVLRSVLEELKTGKLAVLNRKTGKYIADLHIPENIVARKDAKSAVALLLIGFLREHYSGDEDVGFVFL